MTQDKRQRSKTRTYRPPKGQEEKLDAIVRESGLSFNAFVTEAIFNRTRHRPSELRFLARILAECASVADRLRGLETMSDDEIIQTLKCVLEELRMIRTLLMQPMGRRS